MFQYGGNIDYALFTVAQQKENADSGGASKLLEDFCNRLEIVNIKLFLYTGCFVSIFMMMWQFFL
ncbi:MAG: hypothetical protein K2N43_07350 [Lachnospiraceae bacterium]|nr:hypothetical protein [Lachnospiraceae bacterium]